jgi:hypothetical protein
VKNLFNVQELLLCKAKRHETKLMHPSSSRAFQRDHIPNSSKKFSFHLINFQWKNYSMFKNFAMQVQIAWNQANTPLLLESFPKTPHSQFLKKFQLPFNLIFSEKIIQCSRTFAMQVQTAWNQAHAPLLLKSFLSKETTFPIPQKFSASI